MNENVSHLLNAQQFWIIKDHEDAADDCPAEEMQTEAEQREPDTPWWLTHGPQTRSGSHRLPVTHDDLTQEDKRMMMQSGVEKKHCIIQVQLCLCCCTCSASAVVKQ